jgi:hypothetical protein
MRIAVKEGTKSIALWRIRVRHHMLNIPRNIFGIRAHKFCEWYFTQMSIFNDAGNYERPQ